MKGYIPLLLFTMLIASCMKEELPVPAHPRGDAREIQVCMGPGYQEQHWMDLGSGEIKASNLKTAWSLAFESRPDGWRVMLNGSLLMTAWNVGDVDMDAATDTVGMAAQRRIDAPSGHPDSTAFGDWRADPSVHIVDLGYDALGQHLGFRKVRMISVTNSTYTFRTALLDGSGEQVVTLNKDADRSNIYYSFATGQVDIEPAKGSWDLVITQYTHQFHEPFLPYIVVGALIDGTTTRAARITNADFRDVSLSDTLRFPLQRRRDVIGFDWKEYSFDTGTYLVDPSIVYIVQDHEGYFHKLHFLDFYGPSGQAGCPLFEVEQL